jgi:ADP-heptose:LPS heptosyltransferase
VELGERLGDVRRIVVLKAGGLGDLVFALPALEALRAAYPAAELVLLTSGAGAELLSRHAPIDRALAMPPFEYEAGRTPSAMAARRAVIGGLAAEGVDLGVQLHGGGAHSNPLVRELGARLTVGLQAPGAPPLDRNVPYEYFRHEVLRCLEVAGAAGAAPVSVEPRLALTEEDRSAAAELLLDEGKPLVAVHPGAGDPRRRWPAAGFAAVCLAAEEAGAATAVVGTPGDEDLGAAVRAASPGTYDLCGRLSMRALAGVLGRAGVVVSNDSGPLHLAAAVGASTVGIYWCGNLVNAGPLTSTRRRALASWRLECPVCGVDCMRGECPHRDSFVAEVPVADVVTAALELLAGAPPRPSHRPADLGEAVRLTPQGAG